MRYITFITLLLFPTIKCYCQRVNSFCNPHADARREVESDASPYKYVCHIIVTRRFSTDPSTAFLVSPTMLLTAGHSAGEWRKIGTNKIKK